MMESCSSFCWKHFIVKLINFDWYMTSECTSTMILAFSLKTGQSGEYTRHRIFLFGFFSQREDIISHYIGLISDSRLKGYPEWNQTNRIFFSSNFRSTQAPVLRNADLWYSLSRFGQNTQHICRVIIQKQRNSIINFCFHYNC